MASFFDEKKRLYFCLGIEIFVIILYNKYKEKRRAEGNFLTTPKLAYT